MELLDALDRGADEFRARLSAAGDEDWSRPTPCEEWDGHVLVAHVVGGNRCAAMILDGAPASAAIEQVMGTRQLGDEPLADFDASIAGQRDARG